MRAEPRRYSALFLCRYIKTIIQLNLFGRYNFLLLVKKIDMVIDIVGDLDDDAVARFEQNVLSQLDNIGESIYIKINSLGGYVDVAEEICTAIIKIADEKNIKIITENTGDVMSAATLIYCLGTERIWNKDKGDFVIHNPYCTNIGDAKSMHNCGKTLEEMEQYFADIYASVSDLDKDEVLRIMDLDTPMKAEDILEYGFATKLN